MLSHLVLAGDRHSPPDRHCSLVPRWTSRRAAGGRAVAAALDDRWTIYRNLQLPGRNLTLGLAPFEGLCGGDPPFARTGIHGRPPTCCAEPRITHAQGASQ